MDWTEREEVRHYQSSIERKHQELLGGAMMRRSVEEPPRMVGYKGRRMVKKA